MCFKVDHVVTAFILAVVWILALADTDGKGSDSIYSSNEVLSEEDGNKGKSQNKRTGNQHKFWVPTYHGNNPLNRRKIGVTTSEIEKYDKSIDISLSGVGKKNNASNHKYSHDVPSIPFLWSGDDISSYSNKSISFFNSDGISLEDSLESKLVRKEKLQVRGHYASENKTERSKSKKKKSKKTTLISETRKPTYDPHDILLNKTNTAHNSSKKEKVSQLFFDELDKVRQNESERDSNYYKKLVKIATENTKQKLGYKKTIPLQPSSKQKLPGPDIVMIDLKGKQAKSSISKDKIGFITRHEQAGGMDKEFDPKIKGQSGQGSKQAKSSSKPIVERKTSNKHTIDTLTHNTTGARIENYYKAINNTSKITVSLEEAEVHSSLSEDESLSELDDYSAWSDVLHLNKTRKKGKKRKPKTGNPELFKFKKDEDRSIPRWSKKDLKTKADKLRFKQGKVTRQEKKQRAVKRRDSKKIKDKINDRANYENYPDEEKKRVRMRTTGEKRYAVNSVRHYLEEGDRKYNVRPGKSQRVRQSNRYDTYKDNLNPGDRDYSYSEEREDFRERGDRWRPRNPRAEGRWGNRRGSRRSSQGEFRDRGPPRERGRSSRGGRYKDFQRRKNSYNERAGKYDFNGGEERYENDRREYRGGQGSQGRYRERYSNDGAGRKRWGGKRGGGGRRRRGR